MAPLVTCDWLAARLTEQPAGDATGVVVCHVGTTMTGPDPAGTYLAGHLPGAWFVSLDDTLAGPAAPGVGRHPLPTPDDFASALGAIGIADDAAVVAYDDRGGAFAARLVWMLRSIGRSAALLDGGPAEWIAPPASRPLETGPVHVAPAARVAVDWGTADWADADAVAAHLATGGAVIDSREPARFRGDEEPLDAVAGHIPGAINLPFQANLVDGRFRTPAELARRFAAISHDADAIVYCGSGVTACHNALAIEAAGLPRPRVYVGSWSGWSSEPGRPIATD